MKKIAAITTSLFFTGLFVAAISFAWLAYQIELPNNLETDKIVLIKQGSSVRAIANKLHKEKIINSHLAFMIKARLANRKNQLKAGEYKFKSGTSISDSIRLLQSGKTHFYEITLPEGLTSLEIVEIINNNEILAGEKITEIPVEGSLLPETYNFTRFDNRQDIIKRMQKAMRGTIDSLWETRAANLPIKTKEEALILASIVEKETAVPEERARVAGVFTNRLNRKIALQTDPTVIYAITLGKRKLERSLTYKDLKYKSPYNTYVVRGLPPTPIANPGLEAIKATLNPENNDYIYFVANGTGGHTFAKTLEEHNKNVAVWRKIKRSRK